MSSVRLGHMSILSSKHMMMMISGCSAGGGGGGRGTYHIEVTRGPGQTHSDSIECFRENDLAAQTRSSGESERLVEHVVLGLAGLRQAVEGLAVQQHVAGGAGADTLAGALHRQAMAMCSL
eukprot:scaffold14720_cov172-Ochromonas_danica.AAC.6